MTRLELEASVEFSFVLAAITGIGGKGGVPIDLDMWTLAIHIVDTVMHL